MRLLDEAHLRYPFYGSRRLSDWLGERGVKANRKRVRRLMRLMGLEALYPRPRTSRPGKGHKVYPYLLRDLTVERPNQVWAADIEPPRVSRRVVCLSQAAIADSRSW